MVPLSRRRSRKGINQGPNKTRFSPEGPVGGKGRRGRGGGKREGRAAELRRRGKTLIILRQTHRGRAQVYPVSNACRPDGGIILGKGRGLARETRERSEFRAAPCSRELRQKRCRFDVYENETVIVKEFTAREAHPPPPPPEPALGGILRDGTYPSI